MCCKYNISTFTPDLKFAFQNEWRKLERKQKKKKKPL